MGDVEPATLAPVSPEVRRALDLPPQRGALVGEVVSRSPAAAAGIMPGDVVTVLGDVPIQSATDLTRRVARTPPGTEVPLRIVRKGGERTVTATLGRLPDEPTSEDR